MQLADCRPSEAGQLDWPSVSGGEYLKFSVNDKGKDAQIYRVMTSVVTKFVRCPYSADMR